MYINGMMKKLWLILEFMTLQTGQEIMKIHILPNISKSEGNHAKSTGQLKNIM